MTSNSPVEFKYNSVIIIIIITRTMFMVLSSWLGVIARVHPVHAMNAEQRQTAAGLWTQPFKFTVFLYHEVPQWGSGWFCGKFWIFEQTNEQKPSLKAVIGRARLVFPKVRKTIGGILTSPNQNIDGDVSPSSPAGWTSVTTMITRTNIIIMNNEDTRQAAWRWWGWLADVSPCVSEVMLTAQRDNCVVEVEFRQSL